MSYAFTTGEELIALCENEKLTIAEVMIRHEMETSERDRNDRAVARDALGHDVELRLGLADDLILLLDAVVDQPEGDERAEGHGVGADLGFVDDDRVLELRLDLADLVLVVRLRVERGVVFGVLAEVAVGARLGDRVGGSVFLQARY